MSRWLIRSLHYLVITVVFLFAVAAMWIGFPEVTHWRALALGTLAYYATSSLAGIALFVCAVVALFFTAQRTKAAVGGLVAASVLVANQALGLWLKTILCTTPT
jgi:hypothetical protein